MSAKEHRARKTKISFINEKTLSFLKLHSPECRRHMWQCCASTEGSFFFNLKLPVFTRLRRTEANSEGEEVILYKVRKKGDANHSLSCPHLHINFEEK